ncbi:Fucose permease [Devosia crocina]|uniref:Fucose permease n=1 Tax=Devosia crocina TaxID=429728 RepID=A0A1I7MYG6_9HYPH|nr:MFS transporter [Devosia crocina]SFV27408.1 Fucose permease [Devosia crocina]
MKPHHRIYFLQFSFALTMGGLLSRLPDLQTKFGLTEGQVGLLLITMSFGVLCGLTVSGGIVQRLGARLSTMIAVFGASALYALVPWMPSAPLAAPFLFCAGILAGSLEITANVEADRHEAALGRRIMSRVHGMWSLGFFVTALIAAIVRQLQISVELHMLATFLVVLASGWIVFSPMQNAPRRPEDHGAEAPHFAFPTVGLLPLCLLGAAPLFVEGAGVDWSAIYMRDVFAVEPFVGGLSVTLFSLAIAIGRLSMDRVVEIFSPRRVARVLLVLAVFGLVLVASAVHPAMALAGFVLAGIGCSSIYPLAISAAARRTDRPPSVNVAALSQMTFVVFFAGPPLLGFIAEHFGIRLSYSVVVPVLIAAFFTTSRLAGRTEA